MSRPTTGKAREPVGTRSTTTGLPWGSDAEVTTPVGLCTAKTTIRRATSTGTPRQADGGDGGDRRDRRRRRPENAALRAQQLGQLVGRDGPAPEETLPVMATAGGQVIPLHLAVDALGHDLETEVAGQVDGRM